MAARKSKPVTVQSTFVQRKFGELTRRVFSGHEHFIVQREGLPVMAIISMNEYEEFMKDREEQQRREESSAARRAKAARFEQAAREIGEEVQRMNLSEDEIDHIVETARQELYDTNKSRRK